MLKLEGADRFQAKCASCMRDSPFVDGPAVEAKVRLKAFGWAEGLDNAWDCTICTNRKTQKQKRFTGV